jgi:hypothetical protein
VLLHEAKLRVEAQKNDLRRGLGIADLLSPGRFPQSVAYFNGLLGRLCRQKAPVASYNRYVPILDYGRESRSRAVIQAG